jgi:hypothetical protein
MEDADPFRPFEPAEEASARGESRDEWTPIAPVPHDASKLQRTYVEARARPGFRLSKVWTYRSALGETLMHVARYDGPIDGAAVRKDIRPFT